MNYVTRGDIPKLWRAVEKARRNAGDAEGAAQAAAVARMNQGINAWVREHGRLG